MCLIIIWLFIRLFNYLCVWLHYYIWFLFPPFPSLCPGAFWVTPPSWRSLLERRKWLVFSLRLSHSHRPAAPPTPPWVSGARRPLRGAVTQGAELTGPRQSCCGVESSNRIPVYGGRSVERRVEWWEVPYPWTRCSPETCWTERTCRPAGNRGIKKKTTTNQCEDNHFPWNCF